MAKSSRATVSRLAMTVNARYYPEEGIVDAYCLDGRFPGKREQRAVDTTVERESRGFLVSVFGCNYPAEVEAAPVWRESLTRLAAQMKDPNQNIDNDLNDIAESAMEVTGRIVLRDDTEREPYFAGIVLRDGEMAAVTLGDAVTLLYRNHTLYPLTDARLKFEPVDARGREVPSIRDFIAGEAGTIRYSNIAQVEVGDVLLLCNQEFFAALGQQEILRILQENEDHVDAASILLTTAFAKLPSTSLQVMLCQVEHVEVADKATRLNLGRFATQAMSPVKVETSSVPSAEMDNFADGNIERTQRYQRQDVLEHMEAPERPSDFALEENVAEQYSPQVDGEEDYTKDFAVNRDYAEGPGEETGMFTTLPDDDFAMPPRPAERAKDDFAYHAREYESYDNPEEDDVAAAYQAASAPEAWQDHGVVDYVDDELEASYYEDEMRAPKRRVSQAEAARNRQRIFYGAVILIIILCVYALIRLISMGSKPSNPPANAAKTTTTGAVLPNPVVPVEKDKTTTTTTAAAGAATTTTTATTVKADDSVKEYEVADGDTPYELMLQYYDTYSEELVKAWWKYNGNSDTDPESMVIRAGQKYKFPPLKTLLPDSD